VPPGGEDQHFRSQVLLDESLLDDLRTLLPRLAQMGYEETAIGRALQTQPFTYRRMVHLPVYRSRLRDLGVLGTAVLFFLLQESIELEPLRACIGDAALSGLQRMGWLALGHAGVRCRVNLYPCRGLCFWTDTSAGLDPWPEQVYWLGEDSYTLAYCTPRRAGQRALDLCSGSGVHAILAATHTILSEGIDINPRALQFGRLNAAFNELEVEFQASDCYAQVTGDFDLITLNPPFAPAPAGTSELYRAGGLSGEVVTEQVMRGLPQFLRPGGVFSMGTEAPRIHNHSPLERLAGWLGPDWGVAALYKHEFSIEDYIQSHVLAGFDYAAAEAEVDYERWLAVYLEMGITSMVAAQFFAVRGASFRAERKLSTPLRDHSDLTGEWLQALASSGPALALHSSVSELYFGDAGVVVEFSDNRWHKDLLRLGPDHARVLHDLRDGVESPADEATLQHLACELVITRT